MNAVVGYGKGAASATARAAAGPDARATRRFLTRACKWLIAPLAAAVITLCVNWHVYGSAAQVDAETTADYFEDDNLPAAYGFLPIDYDGGLQ